MARTGTRRLADADSRVADAPSSGTDHTIEVTDRFDGADVPLRRAYDAEQIFKIDNGALRIIPPLEPGWGRHSISYGPFVREPGLAFAVYMLNGHNTAQAENLPEPFQQRIRQWLLGSGAYGRGERLRQWWTSGRRLRTLRLFRWWWRLRRSRALPRIDQNLAVGWFADPTPSDPVAKGTAIVMHATGAENGELWTSASGHCVPVLTGVRNVPLYLVVVLRSSGAAYYVASTPETRHLPGYGSLRPIGIERGNSERTLYGVISQSTLGQIGFRIDSRVYGVHVKHLKTFSQWFGSAHAADAFASNGTLHGSQPDIGPRWAVLRGAFARVSSACIAQAPGSLGILNLEVPTGLLHSIVDFRNQSSSVGFVWRFADPDNCLELHVSSTECVLRCRCESEIVTICRADIPASASTTTVAVQVLDDGHEVRCIVGGRLTVRADISSYSIPNGHAVGLRAPDSEPAAAVSFFEAHPRSIQLPPELDLGCVRVPNGSRIAKVEKFEGPPRELIGKPLSSGEAVWERLLGRGTIDLVGDGTARVRATNKAPNPGRTLFAFPWENSEFADLELIATLPGTDRGQRERARIGFVLWQDARNYITVNTWNSDGYDGGSMSSFFHIDGFEDLYDAVWVNVGRALWWGRTVRLRLRCDGSQYVVELNDEPVLYRKLSDVYPSCQRLKINKVGIVVNWEWGDDTGTVIREFTARDTPISS